MELFGDFSDYSSWSLESEYSTGGENYKTWSKHCRISARASGLSEAQVANALSSSKALKAIIDIPTRTL